MNNTLKFQAALISTAVIAIVQPQVSVALSLEEVSRIAEEITVLILGPSAPGSGIIISRSGNTYSVLAAKHVIQSTNPGEETDIVTYDRQQHRVDTRKIQKFYGVDGGNNPVYQQ